MIKLPTYNKKRALVYISTIILSVLYIWLGNRLAVKGAIEFEDFDPYGSQKARVTKIIKRTSSLIELEGMAPEEDILIIFEAKVLTGRAKGDIVKVQQTSSPFSPMQLKEVEVGDKVLIFENLDLESDVDWFVGEYVRTDSLLLLGGVFMALLILFGQSKGVNTIISLLFTCLAVFLVFIPSVLSGQNIYLWSITTCVFVIVMTMLIINGADQKSLTAGAGCISGVLLTGVLTIYMDRALGLTGLVDDESVYLMFLNPDNPVDLKAIIFAAIIIGAMGAIMDVAMSIASALMEVKENTQNPSFALLMRSGFAIGRDMMGTMANTLILAYIGSSLSVTLLLVAYNKSLLQLMNREMIVVEVLQALVGSFGILFAIPFTTLICAVIYTRKKDTGDEQNSSHLQV